MGINQCIRNDRSDCTEAYLLTLVPLSHGSLRKKIFLVPTLTATWENEIFPQKSRETSSCWAGAQETQQPSLPTTSCTPIAWLYLHHLQRGGRVVSAHQSDYGCHKDDLLFKWIWRVVIFLWMKKKVCSQCCRETQSSPSSEDITCSYSQQHIAFVAIFISLKKKGGHGPPFSPMAAQAQLSSEQEGLVDYSSSSKGDAWVGWIKENLLHRCIVRLVLGSEQCPPAVSANCRRWSKGHHGLETIPSRPACHSPLLLVGMWWECSSLPADLKARDQSQAHLITSMRSGSLHHYNSESNFGFPLDHRVFLWL